MPDVNEVVKRVKEKEHELDVKLQASDALLPLAQSLSKKVQSKVANSKVAFLKQICSEIGEKIENQDFSEITKALEKQTELLEDKSGKQIIKSMVALFEEVSKLQDKEYFNQGEFDAVFSRGVERIIGILVAQKEIPSDTWYFRDKDGKIKEIVEQYAGFTLNFEWKRDRAGELVNVKATKNVTKQND